MLRRLSEEEIQVLSLKPGVDKVVVKGFLCDMRGGSDVASAMCNLMSEAYHFSWNEETYNAVREGIMLSINQVECND